MPRGPDQYSVGYDLTDTVRSAILQIPEDDWVCSLDQDGHARPNGQVCQLTERLDLSGWPQGARVIVGLERDHRGRARVEDRIRNDKDTGLRNLPFRDFAHHQVWLQVVRLAHDIIVWTQRLLLTGELANAKPTRLRYRLLHVAAPLAFPARTATLHLPAAWPWASQLAAAFTRLAALPAPA